MLITLALFAAGIAMGLAGACMWAWGVKTGQFRDMEKTKEQLFWPDLADGDPLPGEAGRGGPGKSKEKTA